MSSTSSVAVKDAVHKLQLCLLEGISSEAQLVAAGSLLSQSDYQDVVTERSISQMCGYPLCINSLVSPSEPRKKGRYRISLKEHKVYDLLETHMYCSTKCVVDSQAYAGCLPEERCLTLDTEKIDKVVTLFEGLNLNAEEGLGQNGELGFSKLKIKEKEDGSAGGGLLSVEEWIGPSNAIEGYVTQHDRSSKNRKPGSKSGHSKLKSGEDNIFNEMDFMSTIITQDNEYSIAKEPSEQTKTSTNTKSKILRKKVTFEGTNASSTATSTSAQTVAQIKKELADENTEMVANYKPTVPEASSSACQSGIAVERASDSCKEAQSSSIVLKSSLKASGATRAHQTVSWADEKSDGARNQTLCEFNEGENEKETMTNDDAFRFASAEACAVALSQAAEAVTSGDSDVSDAVSEAGLTILPPPLDDDEVRSEENFKAIDPEPVHLKWQKKKGISESDFFDSEDSWYDSPPDGFSLALSPFATMFMALFAWISSSSLAYIYGRDDSFHEEYASVNGREYPRKVISIEGRSPEIKQTLAGCLARALPGLVSELRLPTPISTIECAMGCLLDTMSFLDPLPSLKTKQWQLFALLFIEALSVCRIPVLASHMTNRRRFLKVFNGAQISAEEYELMRDLVIPLGRVPQIASLSGG